MLVTRKEDVKEPFLAPLGEEIFELIGTPASQGGSVQHSLAYVVIPPGKLSPRHYHTVAEESYYMLKGRARMIIEGTELSLTPGQAVLIKPREVHQIFNDTDTTVEFLVACAPAWQPGDFFEAGE
jgi:mannose-6-phosphate isomerase-like protein (cupin superfamily)